MDIQLPNDVVRAFPIHVVDSAGDVVPAAPGDVFLVVSGDTTRLNAVIGTDGHGNTAVLLNALVAAATAVTITVTDADGLTAFQGAVDIVEDLTPRAVQLDTVDYTDVGTQAVPQPATSAAVPPPAGTALPAAPAAVAPGAHASAAAGPVATTTTTAGPAVHSATPAA